MAGLAKGLGSARRQTRRYDQLRGGMRDFRATPTSGRRQVGGMGRLARGLVGGNSPVMRRTAPSPSQGYAGKAGGGRAVGMAMKGIGNVLQAIEDYRAAKLMEARAEETHDAEMKAKALAIVRSRAEIIAGALQMGQEVPAGQEGVTKQLIGSVLNDLAGTSTADPKAVRALEELDPGELIRSEEDVLKFTGKKTKAEAKAKNEGKLEAEREGWDLGDKKTFSERERIKAEEPLQAAQKFPSEKDKIDQEKSEVELKSKQQDLKNKEQSFRNLVLDGMSKNDKLTKDNTEKAMEFVLKNPFAMFATPEQQMMWVEGLATTMDTVLGTSKEDENAQAMYYDIIEYGSKKDAVAGITASGNSEAAKKEALRIANKVDWKMIEEVSSREEEALATTRPKGRRGVEIP